MTVCDLTMLDGLAMVAVKVFAPIRPVSLTPLPVKSATPSWASMVIEPAMVAPVADKVTV